MRYSTVTSMARLSGSIGANTSGSMPLISPSATERSQAS